jgi:hypothetical protein
VRVARLVFARWDLVDVHVEDAARDTHERAEASLLEDLSARRGLEVSIGELDVTAWLEPAAELLVQDEREPRPRRVEDEGARGHVAWLETVPREAIAPRSRELEERAMMALVQGVDRPISVEKALEITFQHDPILTRERDCSQNRSVLGRFRLPPYVERGGTQDIRGPFQLKNVSMDAFAFSADYGTLFDLVRGQLGRVLCRATLRHPFSRGLCGTEIVPLAPFVFLVAAQTERIQIGDRGWMPEIDVAFWVPVLLVKRVGPLLVPYRVSFYQPYLFVDSGQAMATGRETYGYHKMIGEFVLPSDPSSVETIAVDTIGFETWGPHVEGKKHRLFTLRETSGSPGSPPVFTDVRDATEELLHELTGGTGALTVAALNRVLDVAECLDLVKVSQVFLKEIRAIEDPRRAAYQAVCETRAPLRAFHRGGLLGGSFELELHDLVSHPIRRELGLADGLLAPRAQFWAQIDFDLERGKVLAKV